MMYKAEHLEKTLNMFKRSHDSGFKPRNMINKLNPYFNLSKNEKQEINKS